MHGRRFGAGDGRLQWLPADHGATGVRRDVLFLLLAVVDPSALGPTAIEPPEDGIQEATLEAFHIRAGVPLDGRASILQPEAVRDSEVGCRDCLAKRASQTR